jgi:EpsI family protein
MSLSRRDLVIGAACLAGAGAAYAMTPHKRVTLLQKGKLDGILPRKFEGWASRDVSDLVAPKEEDSLSAKLYQETIERTYQHPAEPAEVMMLMAHGDTQSNELQLHRPEVCYPFFGYAITNSSVSSLKLDAGVTLPVRRLTAEASGRREHIIYWTRLGEYLPLDGAQQRYDRLKTAIDGYVADGLLARFSAIGDDAGKTMAILERFIPAMLRSVPAASRIGLIGTERARGMRA